MQVSATGRQVSQGSESVHPCLSDNRLRKEIARSGKEYFGLLELQYFGLLEQTASTKIFATKAVGPSDILPESSKISSERYCNTPAIKTPADDPYLSEYLPYLSILLHLEGGKTNPALVDAPTLSFLSPPFLDLTADAFPDFGIL